MGYRNVRLSDVELAEIEEALTRLSRAPSVGGHSARAGALKKLADRMAIEKGCAQRGALDCAEQMLRMMQGHVEAKGMEDPGAAIPAWEAMGRKWVEAVRKTGGG